jgi:hypothetical protein
MRSTTSARCGAPSSVKGLSAIMVSAVAYVGIGCNLMVTTTIGATPPSSTSSQSARVEQTTTTTFDSRVGDATLAGTHHRSFASKLNVGQQWRSKRTGTVITLRQVWRKDRLVMYSVHDDIDKMTFDRLKRQYELITWTERDIGL